MQSEEKKQQHSQSQNRQSEITGDKSTSKMRCPGMWSLHFQDAFTSTMDLNVMFWSGRLWSLH
eukprot:872276-Amphidinium_carterae.1